MKGSHNVIKQVVKNVVEDIQIIKEYSVDSDSLSCDLYEKALGRLTATINTLKVAEITGFQYGIDTMARIREILDLPENAVVEMRLAEWAPHSVEADSSVRSKPELRIKVPAEDKSSSHSDESPVYVATIEDAAVISKERQRERVTELFNAFLGELIEEWGAGLQMGSLEIQERFDQITRSASYDVVELCYKEFKRRLEGVAGVNKVYKNKVDEVLELSWTASVEKHVDHINASLGDTQRHNIAALKEYLKSYKDQQDYLEIFRETVHGIMDFAIKDDLQFYIDKLMIQKIIQDANKDRGLDSYQLETLTSVAREALNPFVSGNQEEKIKEINELADQLAEVTLRDAFWDAIEAELLKVSKKSEIGR